MRDEKITYLTLRTKRLRNDRRVLLDTQLFLLATDRASTDTEYMVGHVYVEQKN